MAITRFEDLIAWQRARELTKLIYELTRAVSLSRDYGLTGQMQRASVSIMSNIAEGFERHRRTEFHQYLSIAKASCAEVRSLLYIANDVGYLTTNQFAKALHLAEEVAKIIGGLRAKIQRES